MKTEALNRFIREVRQIWGPLNSSLVSKSQALLEELVRAPAFFDEKLGESQELYRDPDHGFLLLAHIETQGLYRQAHDHGNGWVIYAVQNGTMEMATYTRIEEGGQTKIVRREKYLIEAGQSRVYLPGDIHDTRCVSSSVLMFRLTSCDLQEELRANRMHCYD